MPTIRDRAFLAKIEATRGVDSVPVAGSDGIRIERGFAPVPSCEKIPYDPVKATMGALKSLTGRKTIAIAVPSLVRGSGAAGTAPEIGALLQACGLVETISGGVSVAYDPTSVEASLESVSCYAYVDGILMKALGAVANLTLECAINTPILANFNVQAGFDEAPTTTSAVVPTFSAIQPLVMNSADVISDGVAIRVGSFTLDLGIEFGDHHTTGQNEYSVASRKPTITLSKDSVSTIADWNRLVDGTELAISAAFGSVAGNIMTITAAKAVPMADAIGERNERNTKEITFELIETTGDDQFAITFT